MDLRTKKKCFYKNALGQGITKVPHIRCLSQNPMPFGEAQNGAVLSLGASFFSNFLEILQRENFKRPLFHDRRTECFYMNYFFNLCDKKEQNLSY